MTEVLEIALVALVALGVAGVCLTLAIGDTEGARLFLVGLATSVLSLATLRAVRERLR